MLIECLRLRVKDIEFWHNEILVRQGKGDKDRVTMLPGAVKESLITYLERVRYWSASRHNRSRFGSSAHGRQRSKSGKTMKKTSRRRKPRLMQGEIRREYRFDYRKARPNRFAPLMKGKTVAVVLDPDVASVFQSSESVNSLLRSVISALPEPRG